MEPIFSKVYQTRASWRHNIFGKLLYFQTHATDVVALNFLEKIVNLLGF